MLLTLLQCCGSVVKWKRTTDPVSGESKAFGFCDYSTGESVLRAMRLLSSLPLGATHHRPWPCLCSCLCICPCPCP